MTAGNRLLVVLTLLVPACSGCAPEQPPAIDLARYRDLAFAVQGKKLPSVPDGPYRNGRVLPVYVTDGAIEFLEPVWVKMSPESRATSGDDVGTLAVVDYQIEALASGMPALRLSATVEIIDPEAKVVIYRTTVWRSWWSEHGQGTIISREQANENNDACEEVVAAFISRLPAR